MMHANHQAPIRLSDRHQQPIDMPRRNTCEASSNRFPTRGFHHCSDISPRDDTRGVAKHDIECQLKHLGQGTLPSTSACEMSSGSKPTASLNSKNASTPHAGCFLTRSWHTPSGVPTNRQRLDLPTGKHIILLPPRKLIHGRESGKVAHAVGSTSPTRLLFSACRW